MPNIFKLSKTENKIFKYIKDTYKSGPVLESTIKDIAQNLLLPRMTTHDAVHSLVERGLIDRVTRGKSKYYIPASRERIVNMVNALFQDSAETEVSSEILITKGITACHAVWKKIADLKKGEKVICIQPNESIKYTFMKLGVNSLYPSNDVLNSNGVVSESLVNETCYEYIYQLLRKEKGKDFALGELKKFAPRPSNNAFIDSEYLKTPTELFFMRNTAYLVNWKDEISIEIRNRTIMNFLHDLYILARGYGRKVKQKDFVDELVRKIEEVTQK